jgi:hypothetical protein
MDDGPRKMVIAFPPLLQMIRVGKRGMTLRRKRNLFRDVNERISTVADRSASDSTVGFVCECFDRGCVQRVYLALMEYESLRGRPDYFVIAPGHMPAPYQRVIEHNDRFALVQGRRAASQAMAGAVQLAS